MKAGFGPAFYNLHVRKLLVLILGFSIFTFAKSPRDRAIQEVAKAERDFAQISVADGTRKAFFANFAAEAVTFAPQPVSLGEAFGPEPPAGTPRKAKLDWYPEWTDASASGDFAFSTGPSTTSDFVTGKPMRWGNFASVWRKQSDGSWKVVLDIGTQHAEPSTKPKTWTAGKPSKYKSAHGTNDEEALKLFDRQFANGKQLIPAYAAVLTDESRLHRQGIFPVLGKQAILDHFEKTADSNVTFVPAASVIASSGDLAYTYGSYTSQPGDKKGYYAHFWKREKNGEWKLIIDVTNPDDAK